MRGSGPQPNLTHVYYLSICLGGAEEDHENVHSPQSVYWSRSEPVIS
jgi:hypothetical protein